MFVKTVRCLWIVKKGASVSSPRSKNLTGQLLIDYIATHLRVNYFRSSASSGGSDIILSNSGPLDIPPCYRSTLWAIYFSHATYGESQDNRVCSVRKIPIKWIQFYVQVYVRFWRSNLHCFSLRKSKLRHTNSCLTDIKLRKTENKKAVVVSDISEF